jgi:hypothetical protein
MPRLYRAHAGRKDRRGSALILVLLMTVTLAAVAMSAILLTGSGTMLTKYYDREREFRYAAEAALAMGKAQLTKDTTIHLPDSGYVTLISGGNITGADGLNIPRVKVNLFAGKSGNTTGQFGSFASLVAEAYDPGGTRYVRRLELEAENFARYAMFTNVFPGVCYTTGEFIRGRAHSNQGWNNCGAPNYYDTVSAVTTVTLSSAVFHKGYINGAKVIPIPSVSQLANLHNMALAGNFDIIARGSDLSNLLTRIEFVAIDVDNAGNITGPSDGFFRVYQSNRTDRLRTAPYNNAGVNSPPDSLCGDWHIDSTAVPRRLTFWPIAVHNANWMWARFGGAPPADTFSTAVASNAKRDGIMTNASGFRCYLGGDPHLVAIERSKKLSLPAPVNADWQIGGEDSTWTDSTSFGWWQQWGGATGSTVAALAGMNAANKYVNYKDQATRLWPLYRGINTTTKGVIHVHGPIAITGILRGMITVYAQTFGGQKGYVLYPDDLVYAQDPASVLCANLMGVLSEKDQMIADNAINSPQRAGSGFAYRWTDGDDNGILTSNDFVFHGVMMSRTGTIGVENLGSHAENLKHCNGAPTGRGCIRQAGGVIQQTMSATYAGGGTGYGENRSVDQCMLRMSPPYFPVTGRYLDNRFYEMDPGRFNVSTLFATLQGGF